MPETIVVERMRLEDRHAVLEFLRRSYADDPRQGDQAFWDWHYLLHPLSSPNQIPVWVARDGASIVGQAATRPIDLKGDDESCRAAWVLDLIVDADHRRRGIAQQLVKCLEGEFDALLATPTDRQHSPELFRSLGWREIGPISRFHRPVFPANDVKELRSLSLIRSVVNGVWGAVDRAAAAKTPTTIRPLEINAEIDLLWNRLRERLPVTPRRSSRELHWQFIEQPGKEYVSLGYYAEEELKGYVILFFRAPVNGVIPKGSVADLLFPSGDSRALNDLLSAAVAECRLRECGGIVLDTTSPDVGSAAEQLGFWRVKGPQFLMAKGLNIDTISDIYLTRADSDISIFEGSNSE